MDNVHHLPLASGNLSPDQIALIHRASKTSSEPPALLVRLATLLGCSASSIAAAPIELIDRQQGLLKLPDPSGRMTEVAVGYTAAAAVVAAAGTRTRGPLVVDTYGKVLVCDEDTEDYGTMLGIMIGVHGGIDYSHVCERDAPEDRSICHVAADLGSRQEVRRTVADDRDGHDDGDAWWFGFSCDQRDDLVPLDTRPPRSDKTPAFGVDDPTYKTEAFVYGECVRLAAQLKAIGEDRDPRAADPGPTLIPVSSLEYRR